MKKKDLKSIIEAKNYLNIVIKNYPNTEFAIDSKFKIDLINDILASKEMYIGRYYFERKKWVSAINRFRSVIDKYETTIYVEEALHRLVEIHYILGLKDEAQKYATVLGYNYKSSEWYKNSYAVFDKKYSQERKKLKKKDKKKKNSIVKKIKSLLDIND